MIDINFYMKFHEISQKLLKGQPLSRTLLGKEVELLRNANPVVYNIETTNACNMECKMCPRTTKMTRQIEVLDKPTFTDIVEQLKPWTNKEWSKWEKFVEKEYNIKKTAMSENHFFLYIIPQVIQLHGYGDPLLDKNMQDYVKILSDHGFKSYFSCNPANINIDRTELMFKNGLDYIKYSIESVDDSKHQSIRGKASNFSESYEKICQLLDLKKEHGYKTKIVITMLDLGDRDQKAEFKKLKSYFKGKDVYIYLKSEDQQWYRKDYHGTNSIHWSEVCKHPWMSMSIKSNGEVAMCMEDFNNEIILGNAKFNDLFDIWNGSFYKKFRLDHLKKRGCLKCHEECDMRTLGSFL